MVHLPSCESSTFCVYKLEHHGFQGNQQLTSNQYICAKKVKSTTKNILPADAAAAVVPEPGYDIFYKRSGLTGPRFSELCHCQGNSAHSDSEPASSLSI